MKQKYLINFKLFFNWLKNIIIIFLIIGFLFFVTRIIDLLIYYLDISRFEFFFSFDKQVLSNSIGLLSGVVTTILSISITIIAIIVQLSATRYSPKVVNLFLEEKTNYIILFLFIITISYSILISNTLSNTYIPFFSIFLCIILSIISIIIIIPYFNFVFKFLHPKSFIERVKNITLQNFKQINRKQFLNLRINVNNNIDFIGDLAINSLAQNDRYLSLYCISILKDLLESYIPIKNKIFHEWFLITSFERLHPDFTGYSHFVIKKIEEKKVWIEKKIFKLFELLYQNSFGLTKDIATGVSLNSVLIALSAIKFKDIEVLNTIFQSFNTYLRYSINNKDSRSAFNTLEHYRLIGEEIIDKYPEKIEQIIYYFKYYGWEANRQSVLFILETASFDICRLCELAFDKNVPNLKKLIESFLEIDDPFTINKNDKSLLGVRIAQIKLASYFLLKKREDLARIIYNDLKQEDISFIQKIKNIIEQNISDEYYENTNRGINFFYFSEDRKKVLSNFFNWFK